MCRVEYLSSPIKSLVLSYHNGRGSGNYVYFFADNFSREFLYMKGYIGTARYRTYRTITYLQYEKYLYRRNNYYNSTYKHHKKWSSVWYGTIPLCMVHKNIIRPYEDILVSCVVQFRYACSKLCIVRMVRYDTKGTVNIFSWRTHIIDKGSNRTRPFGFTPTTLKNRQSRTIDALGRGMVLSVCLYSYSFSSTMRTCTI